MNNNNKMKILVLDIENSFIIAGIWGMWEMPANPEKILDEGHMLCWSAKWHGDKKTTFVKHDDPMCLVNLWALLDEADAVLTYNGRRHDLPMINREFLKAGLPPPSPYKHIDLFETVKKQFKFPSNKMQHLLTELKLGSKVHHEGLPLWIKCLKDDPVAWKTMQKYNINDVVMLEKLYNRLLPWVVSHPNRSSYSGETVCPTCGSKHLQQRGYYRTQVGLFVRLRCNDCGHWSRNRYTEHDKEARSKIIVSAT